MFYVVIGPVLDLFILGDDLSPYTWYLVSEIGLKTRVLCVGSYGFQAYMRLHGSQINIPSSGLVTDQLFHHMPNFIHTFV